MQAANKQLPRVMPSQWAGPGGGLSFSSPAEGRLEGSLGVRRVSAGGQNTELLNDFLLLSGPATPGLRDMGTERLTGPRGKGLYHQKGLKNRGSVW